MSITHEEYLELISRDRGTLTPSEFLSLWQYENKSKQSVKPSRFGSPDADLYKVFKEDIKARKSANQFKLACGRASLSISHGRARTLFPIYKERYADEFSVDVATIEEEAKRLDEIMTEEEAKRLDEAKIEEGNNNEAKIEEGNNNNE